ncbi:ParB/RepB/Spo0J family partition protein [Acidicapsa ligni]|uniref:ParB/RepB/Spo0J family partition protein n=1 Tax=Acidicapsa ligni TaxID=542300 RepID=UPI0021E03CE8|nr:ParB/RepB/Spo0J family partition protein [Acidicapsa ligni]
MSDVRRPARALGKGLDSLLPRVTASAPAMPEETTGKPMEVPVGEIDRNPFQTRTHFDEKLLDELAASITANGVVQPILVRPLPNGRFQLIAGERRWLASQKAGKETIPAFLRQVSDEQAMEITIIENLQRADLNPMEQAKAFDRLSREFGMTQEQMAYRVGQPRSSISNFLRLLKLPESVQAKVSSGVLSFGHAKTLLVLESPADAEQAANKILALSLSVRQAETYVQNLLHPDWPPKKEAPEPTPIDPNVREAQERLQRALGLRVRIEDKDGRGRVIIEYARLEDFDAVMEKIVGD